MIFEGIFWDHRAKRSCIESENEWVKYGTLGYTTGKSIECRDGIIDWDCLRANWEIRREWESMLFDAIYRINVIPRHLPNPCYSTPSTESMLFHAIYWLKLVTVTSKYRSGLLYQPNVCNVNIFQPSRSHPWFCSQATQLKRSIERISF